MSDDSNTDEEQHSEKIGIFNYMGGESFEEDDEMERISPKKKRKYRDMSSPPLPKKKVYIPLIIPEPEKGEEEIVSKIKKRLGASSAEEESDELWGEGHLKRRCRACEKGYFVKQDSKFVEGIAKIIRLCAFTISLPALLEEIYKLGVLERERLKNLPDGEDPGEFTRKEIEHHLFNCMTDPTLLALRETNHLKQQLIEIRNHLWEIDAETGIKKPNLTAYRISAMLQNQLKQLLTQPPERSIAFNPKLSVHSSIRKNPRDVS